MDGSAVRRVGLGGRAVGPAERSEQTAPRRAGGPDGGDRSNERKKEKDKEKGKGVGKDSRREDGREKPGHLDRENGRTATRPAGIKYEGPCVMSVGIMKDFALLNRLKKTQTPPPDTAGTSASAEIVAILKELAENQDVITLSSKFLAYVMEYSRLRERMDGSVPSRRPIPRNLEANSWGMCADISSAVEEIVRGEGMPGVTDPSSGLA